MADEKVVEKAFDMQSPAEVSVLRGKDTNIADIDFTENIDELNDAFEREERVIQFKMGEDKVINIAVRGLTSAERITIKGNMYGNAARAVLREFGDTLSDAEFSVKIQETLSAEEELTGRSNERYETVLAGITKPQGIQREHLERWGNFFVDTLYNAIEELSKTPDPFRPDDDESAE